MGYHSNAPGNIFSDGITFNLHVHHIVRLKYTEERYLSKRLDFLFTDSTTGGVLMTNFFISNIDLGVIKSPCKLVKDTPTYNRVNAFRQPVYQKLYPGVSQLDIDPYDKNALILYRKNKANEIRSTFRLALDGDQGLPEERFLTHHLLARRKQGMKIGEFGRLVNIDGILGLQECYGSAYQIAKLLNIDTIAIVTRMQYAKFHVDKIGAKILCEDIGDSFGSKYIFGVFAWDLAHTKDSFFEWSGIRPNTNQASGQDMTNSKKIYQHDTWDQYAKYFLGVTTSFQINLYKEAAKHLCGTVIDLGCGTAKLAPIVLDNECVGSYTGIDASGKMVALAGQMTELVGKEKFNVIHGDIESIESKQYSSGVSINSYYAWPQPIETLKHIYKLLKSDATFVLASPNKALDMHKLLRESEKELIGHPYFNIFKEMNLSLANNDQAKFTSMDTLIQQVQSVGFRVQSCNQEFFSGGMNFLVMTK